MEKLERGPLFRALVDEADRVLLEEHRAVYGLPDPSLWGIFGKQPAGPQSLQEHLRCFFRLSGAYLAHSRGERVDEEVLREKLVREVRRDRITVMEVVPIEGVKLSLDGDVPFGSSVLVRRGSLGDVWTERARQIDQVFFPDALLNKNLRMLDLVVQRKDWSPAQLYESVGGLGLFSQFKMPNDFDANSRRFPRGHGEEIERDLDALRLFDWSQEVWLRDPNDSPGSGFTPPGLGVMLRLHDSMLYRSFPGQSGVRFEPVIDEYDDEGRPIVDLDLHLDVEATHRLVEFIKEIAPLRRRVAGIEKWCFVERALQYVRKAEASEGFNQFLFLVVAVEALFGEKHTGGLKRMLTRRWAAVLGRTPEERRVSAKRFEEFYKVRCDYVHGNEGDERISREDLLEVNRGVRQAIVSILCGLGAVLDAGLSAVPSSKELLGVLDRMVSAPTDVDPTDVEERIQDLLEKTFRGTSRNDIR